MFLLVPIAPAWERVKIKISVIFSGFTVYILLNILFVVPSKPEL